VTEQTQRVLIVEQDRVEAGILAFHLRHSGFKPLLVPNDEEARDAASWAAPHAIVCELKGDRIDGLRFARDLRGAATSFFLVTDRALTAEEDLEALRLGVTQVFTKPVEPAHLTAALQRSTARPLGALAPDLPRNEIAGRFEDVSPVDLGRLWTRHRLDAKLRVLSDGAPLDAPPVGELLLRDGAIIAARHGGLEGRDAAVALLAAPRGTFVLELLTPDSPELRRRDEVNADLAELVTYTAPHTSPPSQETGLPETATTPTDGTAPAPFRLPALPETRAAHPTGAQDERPGPGRGEFHIPPPVHGSGRDAATPAGGRPRSRARRQTPTKPRAGARAGGRRREDMRSTEPSSTAPLRPPEMGDPELDPATTEYPLVRLRRGRRSTQPGLSGISGAPSSTMDGGTRPANTNTWKRPTRRVHRDRSETGRPGDDRRPTTQPGLGSGKVAGQTGAAPAGGARVVSIGRGPRRPITQPGRPVRPADLERSRRVEMGREPDASPPPKDDEELGFAPDDPVEITSSGVSERLSRRPRRFPAPPKAPRPRVMPGGGERTGTPGLRAPALAQTEDLATFRAAQGPGVGTPGAQHAPPPRGDGGNASEVFETPAEDEEPAMAGPAGTAVASPAPTGIEDEAQGPSREPSDEEEDGKQGEAPEPQAFDRGEEDAGAARGGEGSPEEDGEDGANEGDDEDVYGFDEDDETEGGEAPEANAAEWAQRTTGDLEREDEAAPSDGPDEARAEGDPGREAGEERAIFAPGQRPKRRLRRTSDEPARGDDDVRYGSTAETVRPSETGRETRPGTRPVTRVDLFDVADGRPQEAREAAGGGRDPGGGRGRTVAIVVLAALWLALVAFIAVRLASRPPATPAGTAPGAHASAAPAQDPVDAAYEEALRRAQAGETDRAIAGLRGVLERRPAHDPARATLATLLFDADRYNEALPLFQRLASDHPDDPAVLWHLGHIHRALGDLERARAAWTRYLAVTSPDAPQRGAVERLVRRTGAR